MKKAVLLIAVSFLISACTHVISRPMRDQAHTDIQFSAIKGDPEKYKGEIFILGGVIVETRLNEEGSVIEAMHSPIDSYGRIIDPDVSSGRYIAITKDYLDPLIYKKGREITLAGELIGSRKKDIGEVKYRYPLFEIKEIYIWKETKDFYFYPPYPPYRHRYPYGWYAPWWYGPYYYPPYP
ncbi:MAG: Slp family lipoprotein [Nitrospirae bacterium]|nr:Slp family lipoprotein [Nitrospirota bacterium]